MAINNRWHLFLLLYDTLHKSNAPMVRCWYWTNRPFWERSENAVKASCIESPGA